MNLSAKAARDRADADLELLSGNAEKSKIARAFVATVQHQQPWHGNQYIPPGTLLQSIVGEFEKKSNTPLEIPLFITLSLIATILLQKNVTVNIKGIPPIIPEVWMFILAASGAKKSYTFREILRWSGLTTNDLIWDITTSAGPASFVEEFSKNNYKLAKIEEAAEYRRKISDPKSPMNEIESILLKAYDHDPIGRKTKASSIEIDSPAINILGLSIPYTFVNGISPDEMVSGYMQRHLIVLCEKPTRKKPALLEVNLKKTQRQWDSLKKSIIHKDYYVSTKVKSFYKKIHSNLNRKFLSENQESGGVPESFVDRIMWATHSFAAAYHLIIGEGKSQEISCAAYGYAERIIERMFLDMSKIFTETLQSEVYRKILRAFRTRQKLGRPLTPSDVSKFDRRIANIREARDVANIANEMTKC